MTTPEPDHPEDRRVQSRRAFTASALRAAAYVTPAVLVLQRPVAARGVSCKPNGSPCVDHAECCNNCCKLNMMGAGVLKCRGAMNCP